MSTLVRVKAKRLTGAAVLPTRSYEGDAGFDLYAAESQVIPPRQADTVRTGIALELPPGTEAQIRPRSGLALEYLVTVLNSPATIDEGYRGEIVVILINHGELPFKVLVGMRVAQLVVHRRQIVDMIEVDEIGSTNRGDRGLGSTGY